MWLVLELVVIYLTLTVMSIHSHLNKWDIVSFSTYKYVGMICVLLAGLLSASKLVYYAALAYVSAALAFFLLRTLKLRIEPEVRRFFFNRVKARDCDGNAISQSCQVRLPLTFNP